jgi:hypothetical protein
MNNNRFAVSVASCSWTHSSACGARARRRAQNAQPVAVRPLRMRPCLGLKPRLAAIPLRTTLPA